MTFRPAALEAAQKLVANLTITFEGEPVEVDELADMIQEALSATSEPPVAWKYEDEYGNQFLTSHTDSLTFSPGIKAIPLYAHPASPSAGGEVACQHKGARFFNGKLSTTNSKDLFIAWCEDCGAARTTLAEDWLLPKRHLGRGLPEEWQPIETAPKDGKEILLYCPESPEEDWDGHYAFITVGSWSKHNHVPIYGWVRWEGGEEVNSIEPTHWMPLPSPPDELQPLQKDFKRIVDSLPIPKGWVMVPREPTPEMLAATQFEGIGWNDGPRLSPSKAKEVYKAMIAAAPEGEK